VNKKQLRHSFNEVLYAAGKLSCEDLHHKKSHQHDVGVMCPAEYELNKHIMVVREYMKKQGL
jgi:hypothetical protein